MIKVMILDDEALPRIALRNIVEKKYNVVGTAASATEAMELAEQTLPDIILVDIILPDVNGLDFIRNISERLPLTKYIVISNVDNTEYLKTALRLDVFDYLAKDTLSEEELLSTIECLSKKIGHERSVKMSEETEAVTGNDRLFPLDCLNEVLDGRSRESGTVRQALDTYDVGFYRGFYCCIVLKEERQEQVQYSNSILNLFREILFDSGEGIVLLRPSYNYVCFFTIDGENGTFDEVRHFSQRCITSVKKSFGLDFAGGISRIYSGVEMLFSSYQEAKKAYDYHFYTGLNSVNCFADISVGENHSEDKLKELVSEALTVSNPEGITHIKEIVREIMTLAGNAGISKEKVLGIYLDLIHHAAFLLRKNEIEVAGGFNEMTVAMTHCDTLEHLNEEAEKVLEWLDGILHAQTRDDELIRKLKNFVYGHIGENLSLESISEEVHLSPAYLGQYFKKNTGDKLKNFIMNARVETAKKYLLEGRKTKEIALLVGFSTESYFIQCFKMATGMTPSAYYRESQKERQ